VTNFLQRVVPLAVVLVLAELAQAQTFTTLYNFGGLDGNGPFAGVVQDPAGNLYGTTVLGGDLNCFAPDGCGVVYEVNTVGIEIVLHSFSGADGQWPYTPVIRDSKGNIYGTTSNGGSYYYGAVFKINSAGKEKVLYNFTGGSDGCYPMQGLVRDEAGNLYGTAMACGEGEFGNGTVFKLDRAGNFTPLRTFTRGFSDGGVPQYGHLTMDKSGNLYGATYWGGDYDQGVLYKLSKNGVFTLLHSFAGGTSDGCYPFGSVVRDEAGSFYGTTPGCGSSNHGTIWKVSNKGKESILHNFAGGASDGCNPQAGVTRDLKGNLYGVTTDCGAYTYYGALYELSAKGKFALLHSFSGGSDGGGPWGEVWRSANGTLFGTAYDGGTHKLYGAIWSYVPKATADNLEP